MMLQVVPTHWYSWNMTVTDESRPVADIATSWWREKGRLTDLPLPVRAFIVWLMVISWRRAQES